MIQLNRILLSKHVDTTTTTRGTDAMSQEIDNRIAIVGYSAILPGGENVYECHDMIRQGLDHVKELPNDRVDVTAYFHPDKTVPDKIYCTRGGFIPDFEFDPREFNLNMKQMEDVDANQTLSLLKVKEALEDANIDPSGKVKKNIGVVLGIGGGTKGLPRILLSPELHGGRKSSEQAWYARGRRRRRC